MAQSPNSVPSSRASIEKLKASGMSESAIGRAIGRDSSLIHQIATGKKPGNNMADALDALASGREFKEPERRKTKTGRQAAIRGSRSGSIASLGMKDFLRRLDTVAIQKDATIHLLVKWDAVDGAWGGNRYSANNRYNESVMIFGRSGHGMSAAKLFRDAQNFREKNSGMADLEMLEQFLQRLMFESFREKGQRYNKKHPPATGLQAIDYSAFPGKSNVRSKSSRRNKSSRRKK